MPRDTASSIGAAIRRAREQKGLSQGELAASLGKSQSAISFWEQGRRTPDVEDLILLIEELDFDIGEIFSRAAHRQSAKVVLRAHAQRVYQDAFADALVRLIEEAEELPPPVVELRIANDSPVGAAIELLAKAGLREPPVPVDK